MRLSVRVPLLFLALSIVPLAVMSLIAYVTTRNALERRVQDQLTAVSSLKQAQLDLWLQDSAGMLRQLAQRPLVRRLVAQIATLAPEDPAYRSASDSLLADHLAPAMTEAGGFLSLSVLRATDGIVIASSDAPMLGTSRASEVFFLAGKVATYIGQPQYSLSEAGVIMHLSTPIDGPDGNLVAVLSAHANLARVQRILLTPSAQTASEDTYLINKNRFYVSEPRFATGLTLSSVTQSIGAIRCVQGQSGAGAWLDYRGIPVMGAYRWIPSRDMCIITEMDLSVALAPVVDLRDRLLLAAVLVALIVTVLGLYLARQITRPLARLVAGVEAIGHGRLDHRVPASSRDELGQLAQAFNDMADRRGKAEAELEAHRKNLEVLVEERTSEVVSTNKALQIEVRERAHTEERLRSTLVDLERSNRELEQFAYVASHDLQEPLRMISSFTQLLAKRYKGQLDADADEFIGYAVDGAIRMQRQIQDLLSFSRVATKGEPFRPFDVEWSLEQARRNLRPAIEESGAMITSGPLPTVTGDRAQMAQLFQNLLGNAIKFHGSEPPSIHVEARRDAEGWLFSVRDNGIGIDPRFSERVFVLFQRLHTREAYPGTGIGLAIAKRIVERHGGLIWVESQAGQGATFYFTIPDRRDRDEQQPDSA